MKNKKINQYSESNKFIKGTKLDRKSKWLLGTAETACDCLLKQLLQGVGVSRKKISKNQRSDQWTRES